MLLRNLPLMLNFRSNQYSPRLQMTAASDERQRTVKEAPPHSAPNTNPVNCFSVHNDGPLSLVVKAISLYESISTFRAASQAARQFPRLFFLPDMSNILNMVSV